MLVGWYLGIALEFFVLAKLVRRGWVRYLPTFSAFVLGVVAQNLALAFTYGTARNLAIDRVTAPIVLLLQLSAAIEAFWWCGSSFPKFRKPGLALMALCAGIAFAIERWTRQGNVADVLVQSLANIERGVGFALFFFLVIALAIYSLSERIPAAATRHAGCLAALSVCSAIGWQMVQGGVSPVIPIETITWGSAAVFGVWLWLVKKAPTWIAPEPKPFDHEAVEAAWKAAEKAAGL